MISPLMEILISGKGEGLTFHIIKDKKMSQPPLAHSIPWYKWLSFLQP